MINSKCIFVGNIPYDYDENSLKETLSLVGAVKHFNIKSDDFTKKSKGFGFCEYTDAEIATSALRNLKNIDYNGEAGLQFSINSTDNEQRSTQFNNLSLSLEEISKLSKKLPKPVGRKYTLNFAVTKDTILDADRLSSLFDKDDFIVKITPIHETHSAIENGYDVTTSYDDYDVYRKFEQPLVKAGWDVIVFVPSKEEDSDRITCGNALISNSSLN